MKWFEVLRMPENSLIEHISSERRAILVEKREENHMIRIQYLDEHGKSQWVNPSEFRRQLPPPAGTVPRVNDSS